MPYDSPPITIVNPNAPEAGSDILGEDHAPWRPSRRLVVVAASVLLVAGLITGGVLAVLHHRHGQALDRAALRNVKLAVALTQNDSGSGQFPPDPANAVQLEVYNDGPQSVQVSSVRVDGGAPIPVEIGSDALPDATVTVPLPAGSTCTSGTGRAPRHEVSIAVTTYRGGHVTWHNLVPDPLELINTRERQRCGTLLPNEALQTSIVAVHRRKGWVEVTIDLDNVSVLPLTVHTLIAPEGIRLVAPGLPLRLPAAATPGAPGGSRRLTLRLTVTSCQAFSTWLNNSTDYTTTLHADLQGANENADAPISMDPPMNPENRDPNLAFTPDELLKGDTCSSWFFG